jgi:hypothetical protein
LIHAIALGDVRDLVLAALLDESLHAVGMRVGGLTPAACVEFPARTAPICRPTVACVQVRLAGLADDGNARGPLVLVGFATLCRAAEKLLARCELVSAPRRRSVETQRDRTGPRPPDLYSCL